MIVIRLPQKENLPIFLKHNMLSDCTNYSNALELESQAHEGLKWEYMIRAFQIKDSYSIFLHVSTTGIELAKKTNIKKKNRQDALLFTFSASFPIS